MIGTGSLLMASPAAADEHDEDTSGVAEADCPDIDVEYVVKDGEWVARSGDSADLSVEGDETLVTICAEFPFAVDYTVVGGEEFTAPTGFIEETNEHCAVIGDGSTRICRFRVYCPEEPDEQDCSEPCIGVNPQANFIDDEWVVQQSLFETDQEFITVEGDQQEATICAGEDLNCILRLFVRATDNATVVNFTAFDLLCDECVTVRADELGANITSISTVPVTAGETDPDDFVPNPPSTQT